MSININDLTLGQIKEIQNITNNTAVHNSNNEHPYKIGANYFIRTVTMIQTGKLVAVYPTELVLENAAWVADTGRFTDALKTCNFNEVEIFPQTEQVIVGRQAIIDATIITKLPEEQK